MTRIWEQDVIDSATPLENQLAGVHPRLYLTAARFAELQERLGTEPYAQLWGKVQARAQAGIDTVGKVAATGDKRGIGCLLPHLAMAYRLTGERRYLEAAAGLVTELVAAKAMDSCLVGGHVLHGMALVYDWLHDDLDAATLALCRQALQDGGKQMYLHLALLESAVGIGYTWNHMAVAHCGLMAAGSALYGDVPGIAPWLRCALEKTRGMVTALSDDGASQEGITYGEYYTEFFVKTMLLTRDLLGVDLFADCAYLKQTPLWYLHSCLPRKHWTAQSCLINFGDGVRHHWYGPDSHLRVLAGIYGDRHAQGMADAATRLGYDGGGFLNLVYPNPDLAGSGPEDLPTFHHFADKDIVFMRSDWSGDESLLGFICGPPLGHRALRLYTNEVGGGHMNPNAGSFQLFAHGERLISGDGYFYKRTEYQNTVLVDGVGQFGDQSAWFESLPIRRDRQAARILRAETGTDMDLVIGDVAPAYRPEAGLRKFLRHIYYLKPDCWVIVDELAADHPATFELLFHSDFTWEAAGPGAWRVGGKGGGLRLSVLQPAAVAPSTEVQPMNYTGGAVTHHYPLLRVRNAQKQETALFVTVLQAYPGPQPDGPAPKLEAGKGGFVLRAGGACWRLKPGQGDPARPVLKRLAGQGEENAANNGGAR